MVRLVNCHFEKIFFSDVSGSTDLTTNYKLANAEKSSQKNLVYQLDKLLCGVPITKGEEVRHTRIVALINPNLIGKDTRPERAKRRKRD